MSNLVFTQCAAVLFEDAPTLDELERALDDWRVVGNQAAAEGEGGWITCGPGFLVMLRRGGAVVADIVDRPWPDDPRALADDPLLANAWKGGAFGVASAPGGLARAKQQCWAWPDGPKVASLHRAFVRMRKVIELVEDKTSRALPKDHDPLHELNSLTEMASSLLRLKGAVAAWFPGGESLHSRAQVEEALSRKVGVAPPPVDLWVNLRALPLGQDGDVRWSIVDTVGMKQLRFPDQEAVFVDGQEDPEAVAQLLREACFHLVDGKGIPDGSTTDDTRGRRWKASSQATGLLAPDRAVIRWLRDGNPAPSDAFLARGKAR